MKLHQVQNENASHIKVPRNLSSNTPSSSSLSLETFKDPRKKHSYSTLPSCVPRLRYQYRNNYKFTLAALLVFLGPIFYYGISSEEFRRFFPLKIRSFDNEFIEFNNSIPRELFGARGVYEMHDFENDHGSVAPYWKDVVDHRDRNDSLETNNEEENHKMVHWGPCYPPKQTVESPINWEKLIQDNMNATLNEQILDLSSSKLPALHSESLGTEDLSNLCRPGFLIIGAGKCGTSSLYHYLIGHPRVFPAVKKQIHYFKYYPNYPMKWYLSHFPTTKKFLASGALMTGEASPGYMPYPDVAQLTHQRMVGLSNRTGENKETPKIIAVVRNPLERAWSSYNYNYVQPALKKLRKKEKKHSDEYFRENKLFSFEDLVKAELDVLKDCLKPGGKAEVGARKKYGSQSWAKKEFQRRERLGIPALQDLEANCYGGRISHKIPRKQWSGLVEKYPEKFLETPNLHLVESIVGRGLYALPLEWWFAVFRKEDLFVLCSEDLRNNPDNSVSKVSDFLGLPHFDFTDVVSEGMFNVGGHRGYDVPTAWNESKATSHKLTKDNIPISNELRKEFSNFVNPFNERLFQLTGKKCQW